MKDVVLKPFLKWPGGKSKELKVIIPNLPSNINNYYEPFIGGGAVYFAVNNAEKYFINDKSKDLIDLYKNIKSSSNKELFKILFLINEYWQHLDEIFFSHKKELFEIFVSYRKLSDYKLEQIVIDFVNHSIDDFTQPLNNTFSFDFKFYEREIIKNLIRKITRMKQLEAKKGLLCDDDIEINILTALKSAFYMYFRMLYNKREKYDINSTTYSGIYFFIRNYTYSGMFRYNSNGEFNVPYGGIGYNGNSLCKKIEYISSKEIKKRLDNTIIKNQDFYDFMLQNKVKDNDFIFLDPPYDTEFNTYDQNSFTQKDQIRLANFLINEVKCNWMLVIKNTEFIHNLYDEKGLEIKYFDKSYNVSFMNRNNRETEHLLIRNYN